MVCRHIRHPGYLGFLVWCVGTQLLLVNPICCVVFALVVSTAALQGLSYHNMLPKLGPNSGYTAALHYLAYAC